MATTRWVRIGIDPTAATQGGREVQASLAGIKAEARGGATTMQAAGRSWGASLAIIGAAAVSAGAALKALAATAMQMQTISNTLNLVGGSAAAGARELDFVRSEAKRLGLELTSTADAYAKFAVAARGTALEGEGARKVFSSVAAAAAAMGLSSEQTSGALTALQQMLSKGTVSAEELRGQLGERIPGAFNLAAKAMNMTTQELGEALQKGEILASDLLPRLADALENEFGAAGEKAATGLRGSLNQVANAWTDLKVAILESGLDSAMGVVAQGAAKSLEWLAGVVRATISAIRSAIQSYLNYQAKAIFEAYQALGKLPQAIPGIQDLRNGLLGLTGGILDLRDALAETTDDSAGAARGLDQVAGAAGGLSDEAKKAAQELERMISALYAGLEASDPRRIVREGQDALQVLAKIEAAGLRGTEVWRIAAEAVIAYADALQAATTPIPTPDWAMDVDPRAFEEHVNAQILFDVDQVNAEFKRLEEAAVRSAERLRYEFGGTWERYRMEVEEIDRLLREGAVDQQTAARMVAEAWSQASGEMMRSVEGVFGYLAEVAGETFGKIAGYIANLARSAQGAQQFGANLEKMGVGMGMSGSAAGALGTFGTVAVFYKAIYDLGKQIVAEQKARRYSDGGQVGVSGGTLSWYGGSTKYGGQFAEQMKDLIKSIEDTLGGSFEQLAKISIKVRNDGKDVQAYVDGILIGKFNSVDEAIKAAFGRALRSSTLTGLDDLVAQGIGELNYSGLEEALEKLGALREIAELDFGDGLTSLLESVRGFEKLWAVLQEMDNATDAVVAGFARIAAAEAQAWQAARDSITGRERTAEEERAYREQQAKLFNAELALRKAEVALKRWELEQEIEILKGRKDAAEVRERLDQLGDGRHREVLVRQGELIEAELAMRATHLEGLGSIAKAEGEVLQASLEVQKSAVQTQIELLEAQLAALDQLLAALPTEIDLGEIRLPDIGGAGGAVGAGGDPLGDLQRELAALGRALLPDAARQLAELNLQFEDLYTRARELGLSTEELDRLYGEMLARLQADTRKPWQDILAGSGPQAEFDRIIAAMIAGLQDYYDLGLDGTEVMRAAGVQLAALRDSILSSLSPTYAMRMQIQGVREQVDFLRENFEALGMTGAELEAILGELQIGNFLTLAERMAGYLDDQNLLMELEQMRWELERANLRLQMDLLAEAGLLSEAQYQRLLAIWERLPETAPPGFGSGGGRGRSGRGADNTFSDAVDRFRRATERLIDFQRDLLLGDQSTLSPEEKFLEAQRQYEQTYQAALGGDIEARERFADVARNYLDAARDFFASSESYALIFQQIQRALEVLIGMPESSAGGGTGNAPLGGYGRFGNLPPGFVPPGSAPRPGGGTEGLRIAEEIRNSGQAQAYGNEALRQEVEALRLAQAQQLDEIRRLNATLARQAAPAPRRSAA